MRTRSGWSEQTLAVAVVVVTHLLMVMTLNRYLRSDPPTPSADDEEPLLLVFLPPPRPAATSTVAAPAQHPPRASQTLRPVPARTATPPAASPVVADAAAPLAGRPLTAVYMQQVGGLRERPPPGLDTQRADPFAKRRPTLPGAGATLGVAMREPISAAKVVDAIGSLFGGPSSPCPDNRKDIAALATGDDRAALDRAVDYERRYCRP
ncbi:hypothetical protein [Lysobacter sp. Root559]|uniref:hypothetical protein n=3 Tax=Lysobacter TaxID=68 RepID=UPI000AF9CCE9|nr:hypothetical protein [Lysobacter sp. Root559]